MPYTSAQTGGETISVTSPAGAYKVKQIRERVAVAANDYDLALSQPLPRGAQILWGTMKVSSALDLREFSQTTASTAGGTMAIALVWTARTSLTTNATTNVALLGPVQSASGAAFAANDATRALPAIATGSAINTSTSSQTLRLVPYAATTAGDGATRFNTLSTPTNSYTFGTVTGYIDVQVFYAQYEDTPNF